MKGFMHIVHEWSQTLELLAPSRLWLLIKVTIKAMVGVLRLALPLFLVPLVVVYLFLPKTLSVLIVLLIAAMIYWIFLVTVAARPSLELKTIWYVESHVLALIPITIGVLLMIFLPGNVLWMPAFFFFLFFFYDASLSWNMGVRVLIQTMQLCLNRLPFYCILVVLWYLFTLSASGSSPLWWILIWFFILMSFYLVFVSRLYIIFIHQHYKEYYESY